MNGPTAYCHHCERGRPIVKAESRGRCVWDVGRGQRKRLRLPDPARLLHVELSCGHTSQIVSNQAEELDLRVDGRGGDGPPQTADP